MRGLGDNMFEREGWKVSVQNDRLTRFEHIYIYRELAGNRIELYRPGSPGASPEVKVLEPSEASSEPDYEFAIVVPSGFGSACAALAEPGPSKATMDEVRDRLKVADARVDRFIDFALTGKLA